jgi:Pentapeptide repeats (9 copies)
MLKAALRLAHTAELSKIESEKKYTKKKFVGHVIDNQRVYRSDFTNFVFADCGMRGVVFEGCTFTNCIFSGCYMKLLTFTGCTLTGCHFEICTTTGLVIEATSLSYIEFFRCVFPSRAMQMNLSKFHGANSQMLLNCAAEAHRIGRWGEAEQFLAMHSVELRRLWWKTISSDEAYFKDMSWKRKFRAASRLAGSWLTRYIFGDRISIIRVTGIGIVIFFMLFPFLAMFSDTMATAPLQESYGRVKGVFFAFAHYWSYLVETLNLMVGSSLKSEYKPTIESKNMFEIISRVVGIVYLAVAANFVTKWIGFGPRW